MPLPHWKDCNKAKTLKKCTLQLLITKGVSDEMRKDPFRSLINPPLVAAAPSSPSCPRHSLLVAYNACTNSLWTVKHRIPALMKIIGWTHTHAGMALWTCGGLYITWVVSGDVYSITKKPRLSLKGPDHRAQDTRALLGGFYFFQSHHKYLIWHWSTKKDGFEKCVRMSFFVNMHWV